MSFLNSVSRIQRVSMKRLGESVRYLSKSGGSVTLQGIFDNTAFQVDPETEQPISSNDPRIDVQLSDLPAEPAEGDEVIVRERIYKVVDSQEDGLGAATLILQSKV